MAKRMILVDEKMFDYQPMLQHFQAKQIPTEQSVKSTISKDMAATLEDPSIPEDVKTKKYNKQLGRYLHTKRKLAEVIDLRPTVDQLLDIKVKDEKPKTRKSTRAKKPNWEKWK
jgi:translation elongation factor EF-Ts